MNSERFDLAAVRARLGAIRQSSELQQMRQVAPYTADMVGDALNGLEAACEAVEVLLRLYVGRYVPWDQAGGPDPCPHGRATAVFCRACDSDYARSMLTTAEMQP